MGYLTSRAKIPRAAGGLGGSVCTTGIDKGQMLNANRYSALRFARE
jgi:hypothetical protein